MLTIMVTNWSDPMDPTVPVLPEGKTFDDLHPVPDFMKITRIGWRLTKKGLKMVEFYEVEDGKLEEALQVQYTRELEALKLYKSWKTHIEIFAPALNQ
ncbi:MAG: hypothetical protein ACXACF_00005 [Candidatus Hermodarchaeia archaeon]|jgi:hypothetical protein